PMFYSQLASGSRSTCWQYKLTLDWGFQNKCSTANLLVAHAPLAGSTSRRWTVNTNVLQPTCYWLTLHWLAVQVDVGLWIPMFYSQLAIGSRSTGWQYK